MISIIGGGITGLTLAYFLKRKGYDIAVIERDSRLGGNASWSALGEFNVGIFYHIITSADNRLLKLIKDLAIEDELFPVKTKMGFFQGGKIYPISTLKEFLAFQPLSIVDRLRLGMLIARSRSIKDWHSLDNISASAWLSRLGGKSNYEKVWKPIMNAKFGEATGEVVATDMWFRVNRLADLRNRNQKVSAYFLKGGLRVFFEALERHLVSRGVKIFKDSAVNGIKEGRNGVSAILLDNNREFPCDKIISTVSLPDFQRILPGGYSDYAFNLSKIKYLHNVCLILRLRQQFSPFYQLNIADAGFPFTGIIGADALYPAEDFGSGFVLYISKYLLKDDRVFNMSADEILSHYMPYLRKISPGFKREDVLDLVVTKRKSVEPLHSLNYSRLIPSHEAPIRGLYLLNTSQIYPEPTVLNASVEYAAALSERYFSTDEN